ncbi:DUF3541 domain-containing protein [Litchfieldella rifensis]|uniref:DUF3541 domain-containing protein n=1 Tax=Litchfieldella rifensis TaxID=762643 RepID=A0ABV7LW93_9GAMM
MQGPQRKIAPRQHVLQLGCVLVVAMWLAACTSPLTRPAPQVDIASQIQARYEAELFTLPLSKQRHYAQRLYRITGDEKYLPLNRGYAKRLIPGLREDIEGLAQPGYALSRSQALIADYPTRTDKQRARKQMLGEWGEIAFARNLLFRLVQLEYYQLLESPPLAGHERALDYLATVDFRAFLTDPAVMRVYAAQVANIVYYLHQLGIDDLRGEVVTAFREQYPPERDAMLSNAEYRNKIYGMTHFVIAASRYYQQPVSGQEFAWILEEFEDSLPRILDETTEDIYAEVGISFLLAGQQEHPAIERIEAALVRAYNPETRMIPSPSGSNDLERGEHRNVLAIILFRWPDQLTPGPYLSSVAEHLKVELNNSSRLHVVDAGMP